jgi:excisionase family DNA binding protein
MAKNLDEYPDLLTVHDVCEVLRVGRRTVYQYIQEQKIPAKKIAGKFRIPNIGIRKFINEIGGGICYNSSCDGSDALLEKECLK